MNVLVIAAHPDDEVIGAGGAMALHATRGDEVHALILTEGASAQYPGQGHLITQKKREAASAAELIGVKSLTFSDLPDMKLDTLPIVEVNRPIEAKIAELRPEVVYTHFVGDLNRDHRIVFEATMVATRGERQLPLRRVLSYEVPCTLSHASPVGREFCPNVFADIGEVWERKIAAMKAYQSEVRDYPHPRSLDALVAWAKCRGIACGCAVAEAYVLVRELVTARTEPR